MQTVSTFNRNLVIFLVSLALINIAVGFYKSFNKSKGPSSTQINYKVREHSLRKIPIIIAIGQKEVDNKTVTIRRLGSKNTQIMSVEEMLEMVKTESQPPDQR